MNPEDSPGWPARLPIIPLLLIWVILGVLTATAATLAWDAETHAFSELGALGAFLVWWSIIAAAVTVLGTVWSRQPGMAWRSALRPVWVLGAVALLVLVVLAA